MLRGGLPREHPVADQALAHVPTDDNEPLADLVGMGDPFAAIAFAIQRRNDPQCFQFFPYSREFEFFLYERFVYGFHSDREATNLRGKLDVRMITWKL
jgi:hypothetical protein